MQDKLRFTNVTLVTPTSLQDKDLLTIGDKIVDIVEKNIANKKKLHTR